MVYNDFVICDVKKIKTPAIFVANRPDKGTIVVEYQEKLHEVPANTVRLAQHKEITQFFKGRIAGLEHAIEITQKEISQYIGQIKHSNERIAEINIVLEEFNKKKEGFLVAKRLVQSQDPRKAFSIDIDLGEVNNSIKWETERLERGEQCVFNYQERMQREEEYLAQLERRVTNARTQFATYMMKVEGDKYGAAV